MNRVNAKVLAAVLASALVSAMIVYLAKQREIGRLRAESQNLLALQESDANERDVALVATKAARDELEGARKDHAELLRLRGEVGQMRRLIETQKAQARLQPASAKAIDATPAPPGTYITKERLAHVGYATPEAALQTMTWALMNGTFDQVREGDASPDIFASDPEHQKAREGFEARQKVIAPFFKGLQILASKRLADDKVELKIKMDADPIPGQQHDPPPFMIAPMQKIGDAWKVGGSTRAHQATWDNDGQIQTFVP